MPLPDVNFFYKMVAKRYGFRALRSEVCRGNSKGDVLLVYHYQGGNDANKKSIKNATRTFPRCSARSVMPEFFINSRKTPVMLLFSVP